MARKDLISELETKRDSRVICYFTGDRAGMECQIGDDVLPRFSQHLARIGKVSKLDLLLYSRGGNTLTGFTLANALREFADTVNVLIPFRAHSCATLISLSANKIVAGPFGSVSPIDPSITTPHGPSIQQGTETKFIPVSVEDVANYFELARKEAKLNNERYMAEVLGHLTQRVNPLALGAVYRAREQIGMLATKLLSIHMRNETERVKKIVNVLTRELLSHDYLIGRREAKEIGLPIEDATDEEARLMWEIYEDVAKELKLDEPWNWQKEAISAPCKRTNVRALVESKDLKHAFCSTYQISKHIVNKDGKKAEELQITVLDESWSQV